LGLSGAAMSLMDRFRVATLPGSAKIRNKRPAPFSIRLSDSEKKRLLDDAASAPLGSYMKATLFGAALLVRMRRTGLAVEDRTALAKALALLRDVREKSDNYAFLTTRLRAIPNEAQSSAITGPSQ